MKTVEQFQKSISKSIEMYNSQISLLDMFIENERDLIKTAESKNDFVECGKLKNILDRHIAERSCFVGARNQFSKLLEE